MSALRAVVTDVVWGDIAIEQEVLAAGGVTARLVQSHDEDVLAEAVRDADAILTCFAPVTRRVIDSAPALKVVARIGVGLDNIAVDAAAERGVRVTRVPDYCIDEVATHALGLGLALWRQLPAYDALTRSGGWGISPDLPIRRLSGSRVAVLGRGPIGREVGRRWTALGADVVADPARANLVSVHLPLTAETRGSVDDRVLNVVAPGAILVNCGRGPLVDLDAVQRALDDGRLRGFGTDVYPEEPLPAAHPLLTRPDVLLTPHVAFYSDGALHELRSRAAQSVVDVLTGAGA